MDSPFSFLRILFPRRSHSATATILLVAIAAYACFLTRNVGGYAGGSDSSGYMNMARLLREGQASTTMRTLADLPREKIPGYNDYIYVPLGFRPLQHHTMAAAYPIGLPLMIAFVSYIADWNDAAAFVIVIHSLVGLGLVFALGRMAGLEEGWALVGVLMMAVCPLYSGYSTQLMSDMPAMVWVALAVWLGWQSKVLPSRAIWAGAALSVAILVRPSNALILPALALLLGFSWRRWAGFILGGLPGGALFLAYNAVAYGHPLETGYGDFGLLMSRDFVSITLLHYFHWLPLLLSPFVVLVLGLPWLRREHAFSVAVLTAWMLPFLGFYLFYSCTHVFWWYLRFLLPALPPLTIGALLVGQHGSKRCGLDPFGAAGTWRTWLLGAFAVITILVNGVYRGKRLHAWDAGKSEKAYVENCEWARQNIPANAVIATMQLSGAYYFYTDFPVLRWDMFSPEILRLVDASVLANSRPLYAAIIEAEQDNALRQKMPGRWTLVHHKGQFSVWKRELPSSAP